MKKKICYLIGGFVILFGIGVGLDQLFSSSPVFIPSFEEGEVSEETPTQEVSETVETLYNEIEWTTKTTENGTQLKGKFKNETNQTIPALQIDYLLYDEQQNIIESNTTYEVGIEAGESREIIIWLSTDDYERYEVELTLIDEESN